MFKNVMQYAENVEILPILGLLFFFGFFVLIIVWALRLSKSFVEHGKNLPFDNKEKVNNNGVSNG
jgi:cytochrome c oxidase cbb3-type subunit 4